MLPQQVFSGVLLTSCREGNLLVTSALCTSWCWWEELRRTGRDLVCVEHGAPELVAQLHSGELLEGLFLAPVKKGGAVMLMYFLCFP